jgi:hypothetical protein
MHLLGLVTLPALVFTLSVSYKASIWSLCVQFGNLSFTTHTARRPTGEVTVSFTKDCSGILRIAKDLKLLPDIELSEPYTEVVFDLLMVFTIWVNILAIFGHKAKASAYTRLYNFNRSL